MSSNLPERSTQFAELLARISRELTADKIPYMIFGGQAVLVYGEPRFTQDIDITLGIDPTCSAAVLALVKRLGMEILVDQPEEFLRETFVLPVKDNVSGIRLDLVFSLSEFEKEAIGRAKKFTFCDQAVNFVTLEDLVIFKIIAGRPRDLEDLKGILLKNPDYNRAHILYWLSSYDQELGECFEMRLIDVETSIKMLPQK